MGTISKTPQLIERLFEDLTTEGHARCLKKHLNDLFVRVDTATGEVALYGDGDELLNSIEIYGWIKEDVLRPTPEMVDTLYSVIAKLDARDYWDSPYFERPFSIELVTSEFDTIEHLLFLDDDTIKLSAPLLEGMSADLDKFISDLLGDLN